ncbi:MAG: cyclase family protein [Chloroflexota bacterium]|jgi:kynurenine formamidase
MASGETREGRQVCAGDIRPFGGIPAPQVTPELLSLVRTGQVYSLEQILEPGIPYWAGHPPLVIAPYVRHGDMPELEPASVGNEITTIPMHGCTHIDALCHVGKWVDGEIQLYGGVKVKDVMSNSGYAAYGAENFPPIILRGVLLDVASDHGVDVLPDSYGITGDDLEHCARAQGVEIRERTAVLIRTGFSKYWRTDNARFSLKGAGPNIDGARYLAERKIALVGSDTEAVEQWPFDPNGPPLPVHTYLIAEHGITHVESLYLDRLATDRVYEFLFIALPLRIRGATGSQIHPIAIA